MSDKMYVKKCAGGLYELRQQRFRDRNHPHDVCAVARSVEEMHSMVDKLWPDIDYSEVSP
jgi:hypothetical protein